MTYLKLNKSGTADVAKFTGFVTAKHNEVINLTKIVIVISILLALVMIISK
jgi:hypothetical protein